MKWQTGGNLVMHAIRTIEEKVAIAYCGKRMPVAADLEIIPKPPLNACKWCKQAMAAEGKLKARGSRTKIVRGGGE
jgi:hypothetical protein